MEFKSKLQARWESARTSLWFMPAVLVTLAVILSFLFLWVDRRYEDFISQNIGWLFGGTPSAARSLLSTIASSVITVVSIAFSLTIVAMQQASSQYTPRLLRTFIANRGNQIVLGAYLATFVYSLLILRAVRSEDGTIDSFVPSVASTVAILFALVCVALLVFFINHVATSLQATTVIDRVHDELLEQIDNLYPQTIGTSLKKRSKVQNAPPRRSENGKPVTSQKGGFIVQISVSQLEQIDYGKVEWVHILPKVGDFVVHGQPIARIYGSDADVPDEVVENIRNAIIITNQRSVTQDPLFAVRQMVDTALKGLSPGINDTTTADYCIRYLGNAMGRLAGREFPRSERKLEHGGKLYLEKPTWNEFVLGSFDQILHASADKEQVLRVLLTSLRRLIEQLPGKDRAEPVGVLLDTFDEILQHGSHLPGDKQRLQSQVNELRRLLARVPLKNH